MNSAYTPNTYTALDTNKQARVPGWRRFMSRYFTRKAPKPVTPIPAQRITSNSSRFWGLYHKRPEVSNTTGYMREPYAHVVPSTGYRHEGGYFYANDAFSPASFTPMRIPSTHPKSTIKRSKIIPLPVVLPPLQVIQSSPELPTIFPTFGRRHPDRPPTINHRRTASGPAALQQHGKPVKNVHWAEGLPHEEKSTAAQYKRRSQADAQQIQPTSSAGQERTRHSHDRHRSQIIIDASIPAHGQDESRRRHHRQADCPPQQLPLHSRSHEDTVPLQRRHTVPHYVVPVPVVMLQYPAIVSSPRRDARRRKAIAAEAALKADTARTERGRQADRARLEASIEDTKRREGPYPYGIFPY